MQKKRRKQIIMEKKEIYNNETNATNKLMQKKNKGN